MSTKHPAISPRRDGYIRALIAQKCLAVAFRHAGMLRIFEDNDPLARVYRALNALELRYWLAVTPTRLRYPFPPLPNRQRLLLCRFRAMLLEYRKHGFSFEAFATAPISEIAQSIQDLFVEVLIYPIKHRRAWWKSNPRQTLRIIEPDTLPDRKKARRFFQAHAAEIPQLTSYLRPKRRQIAQCNIKHSRHHSPIPTTPKPHSSSPSPAPAGSH